MRLSGCTQEPVIKAQCRGLTPQLVVHAPFSWRGWPSPFQAGSGPPPRPPALRLVFQSHTRHVSQSRPKTPGGRIPVSYKLGWVRRFRHIFLSKSCKNRIFSGHKSGPNLNLNVQLTGIVYSANIELSGKLRLPKSMAHFLSSLKEMIYLPSKDSRKSQCMAERDRCKP